MIVVSCGFPVAIFVNNIDEQILFSDFHTVKVVAVERNFSMKLKTTTPLY